MERTIRTPVAFLQLFGDVLARSIRDKVFVGGRLNVLDYTDDTELQEIKQLLQLLDAPSAMRQVMGNANDGVLIQIGDENGNSLLSPYSFDFSHIPRATTWCRCAGSAWTDSNALRGCR